jgi:hypothetical protein
MGVAKDVLLGAEERVVDGVGERGVVREGARGEVTALELVFGESI